jgi:hypothetical protein
MEPTRKPLDVFTVDKQPSSTKSWWQHCPYFINVGQLTAVYYSTSVPHFAIKRHSPQPEHLTIRLSQSSVPTFALLATSGTLKLLSTATEMRESSSTVFLPSRPSNMEGVPCLFPSVLQRCNIGCLRLSASATFAFLSLPFNSFLLSLFFCYFLTVYTYLLVPLISLSILRCSFTLSTRPFSTGCVLAAVLLQASTGPWLYPYEYPGTHF